MPILCKVAAIRRAIDEGSNFVADDYSVVGMNIRDALELGATQLPVDQCVSLDGFEVRNPESAADDIDSATGGLIVVGSNVQCRSDETRSLAGCMVRHRIQLGVLVDDVRSAGDDMVGEVERLLGPKEHGGALKFRLRERLGVAPLVVHGQASIRNQCFQIVARCHANTGPECKGYESNGI